jgi:hypothetical protein
MVGYLPDMLDAPFRALQLPGDACRMTTYTIIPKVDQTGFDVAIVGNDGARQTLLGCPPDASYRIADMWIILN